MADDSGFSTGAHAYDPAAVKFFDPAHEGARIRAVASLVADGAFMALADTAPRSIVVVTTDRLCAATVALVDALNTPAVVPLVVSSRLPAYIGALDVVVGCSVRDDPHVAAAVRAAVDRAATVMVLAPPGTALAEDIPSRAITIPAPPTTGDVTVARLAATLQAIIGATAGDHMRLAAELQAAADRVDTEIAALAPDRDPAVNPAARLARHLERSTAIHTATGPQGLAVAAIAAEILSAAGHPGCVLERNTAAVAVKRWRDSTAATGSEDSIFHDPFIDGPASSPVLPLKTVAWGEDARGLPDCFEAMAGVSPVVDFAGAVALTVHAWAAACCGG